MAITRTSDLDINNQSAIADSELGRLLGTIFSTTSSSAMNTMTNNIMKGQALTQGLGQNVGTSLAGAGVGIASNYIGLGITSALGNNYTGRALGAGVSTGLGTVGGKVAGNLITSGKIGNLFSGAGSIYGLAASVVGSALNAGNGPSKEYAGRYGSTTRTMDTVYDGLTLAVNAIPGWGQLASGLMTLNKGLSNVFGSTDGMTLTDAILGSAFMPAPIKWLNVAGAKTTSNFNNLSWQNMEKANSFMGNAFGNLGERFGDARVEAGKTYGRFSKSAYREAQNNIDFANRAWGLIMLMANLNEIQNIRALDMSSINNQRYAQMIQGGWSPIYRGKQGMKIFNNVTNHNIGMRLLSAAALIDNKAMILSAQGGTKVTRPPRMRAHRSGDESRGISEEERQLLAEYDLRRKKQLEEETARIIEEKEKAAERFNQQANIVLTTMNLQANETPFTGLEYQQAAEDLRQKKVEKFHEAEKIGEAVLMADLGVNVAAPLLLRGFRWMFNKAGLLVKVPVQKTIQLKSGITKSVLDNGKIRLSLPSHTDNKPRQFVLEPARDVGDNKYYVHMRMWDDVENKIPASNVTNEEKQQLFDALYDELPEGAEILFPKSGPGFYGTRGTVAGLQRLARDPRFTPGTKGTLQYLDKDGKTVRTYEGTSFIKAPQTLISLESDFKGKPIILSVPKTMRKADSDVVKMNEYHVANVLEYNQSTGNNITSIPFRTDYNGRLVKVLPNEEFNTVVRSKNTNAPSCSELNVGGMYSKNDDTVYLRNTGNPSNNYHEFLHSSLYGETNPEVTNWRIQLLIDKEKVSKMSPKQKAYYISVKETPVHLRLQGERMNINVGDPYPGDEAFDKMINEHGIGGATYYMKRDTSEAKQLLWKAFNGTLFSGLTAATLYNTNK